MKCYAQDYCKGFNSKCNEYCDLKLKLDAIYELAEIPLRYRYDIPLTPEKVDLPSFKFMAEWKEQVVDKVADGEGLYIWSTETGTGKTAWSTKIANYYIRKTVVSSELKRDVIYISCSQFLENLRKQYDDKDGDMEILIQAVMSCKLLIIDDIGAERPTDWARERLYDIINHRYINMKSTIFTSNFSPNQLEQRVGSRIASRIKSYDVVELKGIDRRVK